MQQQTRFRPKTTLQQQQQRIHINYIVHSTYPFYNTIILFLICSCCCIWHLYTIRTTYSFITPFPLSLSISTKYEQQYLNELQYIRKVEIVPLHATSNIVNEVNNKHTNTQLVFPGGGIYFYWQAGVITYLREQGYNLNMIPTTTTTNDGTTTRQHHQHHQQQHIHCIGASAGALTASLTVLNVDFIYATNVALQLASDAGVWHRTRGLQGIWGDLIYTWLNDILPPITVSNSSSGSSSDNGSICIDDVNEKLTILITPIPNVLNKIRINHFIDRDDIIQCNMGSIHIPWFIDSQFTTSYRQYPYIIDGSFLSNTKDYDSKLSKYDIVTNNILIDYNQDPIYQNQNIFSFIQAINPDGIYKMIEDGKRYAKYMEEQGIFSSLHQTKLK